MFHKACILVFEKVVAKRGNWETMAEDRRDVAPIEIEDADDELLASSMKNKMSNNPTFTSSKICIFKVPNILRRQNDKAYVPNAFSIGPLHHNNRNLKATKKIKWHYLNGLISRAPTRETSLKNFIKAVRKLEKEARECYAVPIKFSKDDFVEMLVLDGCFIIEMLRKYAGKVPREENDPIFSMSCMLQYLLHDLILLENQIPWFVLERLFRMTTEDRRTPLSQLAIWFFRSLFSIDPPFINDPLYGTNKHILDLIRNALILSFSEEEGSTSGNWKLIPSATSLLEAGIIFEKRTSNSILDIKFDNGVLKIPPLLVAETTEAVFRNLISLEQCHYYYTPRITSYAILLDNLINTTKDMDVLCQNEIINKWLGPEESTQFFNKLYYDTCVNQFHYNKLSKEIGDYCQRRWPKWRAAYMRNYFGTPWAIASQLVAGILLLLTIVQTVYSIKS